MNQEGVGLIGIVQTYVTLHVVIHHRPDYHVAIVYRLTICAVVSA